MKRDFGLPRLRHFTAPNGRVVTIADLPVPGRTRWSAYRKAELVMAVKGGLLSLEDACERYDLSLEEYRAWENSFQRYGVSGLKATRTQDNRNSESAATRVSSRVQ